MYKNINNPLLSHLITLSAISPSLTFSFSHSVLSLSSRLYIISSLSLHLHLSNSLNLSWPLSHPLCKLLSLFHFLTHHLCFYLWSSPSLTFVSPFSLSLADHLSLVSLHLSAFISLSPLLYLSLLSTPPRRTTDPLNHHSKPPSHHQHSSTANHSVTTITTHNTHKITIIGAPPSSANATTTTTRSILLLHSNRSCSGSPITGVPFLLPLLPLIPATTTGYSQNPIINSHHDQTRSSPPTYHSQPSMNTTINTYHRIIITITNSGHSNTTLTRALSVLSLSLPLTLCHKQSRVAIAAPRAAHRLPQQPSPISPNDPLRSTSMAACDQLLGRPSEPLSSGHRGHIPPATTP